MTISNFASTNNTFTALWPDGSAQSIVVGPGVIVHVPGVVFGGSNIWGAWNNVYEVVASDTGGIQLHGGFSAEGFFVNGFCWGCTLGLVMVAVWMVKRGLAPAIDMAGGGS